MDGVELAIVDLERAKVVGDVESSRLIAAVNKTGYSAQLEQTILADSKVNLSVAKLDKKNYFASVVPQGDDTKSQKDIELKEVKSLPSNFNDNTKTVQFKIEGMTCAACVATIENVVKNS